MRRCQCPHAKRIAWPLDSRSIRGRWQRPPPRPVPPPMATASGNDNSITPTAQLSPAQRGLFFPCPPFHSAPSCWPSSARPVPTADGRCGSPTGCPAATTLSLDRRSIRSTATAPWSAAGATPTRALYRWANGLRACHELRLFFIPMSGAAVSSLARAA